MDVLLGMQWGDEGKGKIVDFLAPEYDIVARFQGGPNAGHTLSFEGKKFVLHQIPSGIFQDNCANVVGNGVVLDLPILKEEIENLEKAGYSIKDKLFISEKATLILPTHRLLDAAYENQKGDKKIGSTLKGIGPTYQDKIGRSGLRVGNLFQPDFKERYEELVKKHQEILAFYGHKYELEPLEEKFFEAIEFTRQLNVTETTYFLNEQIKAGKKILAEGAQGSLLDIDFGSYPFVTSSNTFSAGVCTGLGIAPQKINRVIGIFKAYCTRVGSGPFPTELFDEDGEKLQNIGHEFGATTGRRRRCGWLDLPALKYANMLNGTTELYMMKADVLDTFEEIKVCTKYKLPNGEETKVLPYQLQDATPVYEVLPGWNQAIDYQTPLGEQPQAFLDYIKFIEEKTETPITLVSVGPERRKTIRK